MLANTQGEFKETFELDVPTRCIMVVKVNRGETHVIECPKGGRFSLEKLQEKEDKKKS